MEHDGGRTDTLEGCREAFLAHLELHLRYSSHTHSAYARDTRRLLDFLVADDPSVATAREITPHHVMRFVTTLSGLAPASVCRVLDALSSWFNYLVSIGATDGNPLRDVPRPRREHRLPVAATEQDCRALTAAAETPLERTVLAALIYLGIRKSELLALDLRHFGADFRTVRINGKGSRQRDLPVAAPLRELLLRYLHGRAEPTGPLLLNQAGRRLGATSLQRLFRRLVRRAGLDHRGLALHSMRHGAATQWLRAGADVRTVQMLLGYEDLNTTARYLATDNDTSRRAVELLPDYTDGTTTQPDVPKGRSPPG